ncbi:sodium-dependent neutral amino acid transporter B(0)AT3 [Lepeophtheirus salmonis]|uniref:sodium-dependent neutral amino acid transporter B(0)AT3 n=1 Tax=Lepeophtheirus salmonis TaxID=72036 RepID=UPI001AE9A9FE|nr:sodium-dependent neutral amino acid transporter B(0)AT3-like [Lepeophtheirus salmonis]
MANFAQLVRRQTSRDSLDGHFSADVQDRVEMHQYMAPHSGNGKQQLERGAKKRASARVSKSKKYGSISDEIEEKDSPNQEDDQIVPIQKPKDSISIELKDASNNFLKPDLPLDGNISRATSVSQFSQPPEGEDEPRESWDSKLTFILATIGYAVGLGNVWRFPYLAQKNGGGAFLIPYWTMLFIEGLPLFLLEMAVGQRLRKGSIGVWKQISPYLGGIGIASVVVSFNVALYYNTIIAWCLYYFAQSFGYPLPWSECPMEEINNTTIQVVKECELSSPTQYFWYRNTLDIAEHIEDQSSINWKITACLLSSWILVYLCIIKGITESPIIIYITAIYPYVVLVIFFFRAVTLEGMEHGIIHLFKPKWHKLADPTVWLEAGTQIFFSLGLAFGGLIAYASYNPVNNNCTRDALIVAFTNCCTSMFAGIVIFAIMGYKATLVFKDCQKEVDQMLLDTFNTSNITFPEESIVTLYSSETGETQNMTWPICDLERELDKSASGTGLAFILFTEAVNQFPMGNLWAIMFFLMLFTLGLDSQFGTLQGVVQGIADIKICPNVRKEIITGVICTICFIISLSFSCNIGNYIFTLFDNFAGNIPLLIIAFAECTAISYLYGVKKFSDDIETMTGSRPCMYWQICWKYLAPLAMLIILAASLLQMIFTGSGYEVWNKETGKTTERAWPSWAFIVIFFLIFISVCWIPIIAVTKWLGYSILSPDPPGWFPEEELREFHQLSKELPEPTDFERKVLGVRDDGSEGILFPTKSKLHTAPLISKNTEEEEDKIS